MPAPGETLLQVGQIAAGTKAVPAPAAAAAESMPLGSAAVGPALLLLMLLLLLLLLRKHASDVGETRGAAVATPPRVVRSAVALGVTATPLLHPQQMRPAFHGACRTHGTAGGVRNDCSWTSSRKHAEHCNTGGGLLVASENTS